MSIQGIRKDILELKQAAAFEKKKTEDDRVKNLTDEELEEEIKLETNKLLGTDYKTYSEIPEEAHKLVEELASSFKSPTVYDLEEDEPIFNDDIPRILVPKNGGDKYIIYIPDSRLNGFNPKTEN